MADVYRFPKFHEDLADFVTELRLGVFPSKQEVARYFNLSRSTVSRYESGQLKPPIGYLASLSYLSFERLQQEGSSLENYRQSLLSEVNKVLRGYYWEKQPYQKPLREWQELERLSADYLTEHHPTTPEPETPTEIKSNKQHHDWGEALELRAFYGREAELATLESWVVTENCRLVILQGAGGVGKTTLARRVSDYLSEKFDFILWRSLRHAPPLDSLLRDWIKVLSRQNELNLLEGNPAEQISRLVYYLRQSRCLLVLDNYEAILETGNTTPRYRSGYQDYGMLLNQVGGTSHQGCLLLTSRDKPDADLGRLEGERSAVRSLVVGGLTTTAAREILENYALQGSQLTLDTLVGRYGGNPLALKLISGTIQELYGGNIAAFLEEGQLVFGTLAHQLAQQFERLSDVEQTIMYWLAIGREAVTLHELLSDLQPESGVSKKAVYDAVSSLLNRSLIERSHTHRGTAFSQQPVIMEFVTESLQKGVARQLLSDDTDTNFFTAYTLVKAHSKDYIRSAQVLLILRPVLDLLLVGCHNETRVLEQKILNWLEVLRTKPRLRQGYGATNLANLLYLLRQNLREVDFSGLNLWQARLDGIDLRGANLRGADLSRASFTDTFEGISTTAFSPDGRLLAAGSSNGELRVWRVEDGKPLLSSLGHRGGVHSVIFSPDGKLLGSGGGDRTVKLWQVDNLEEAPSELPTFLKSLVGHTNWVWSVAFSPDSKIIASASGDQKLRLWRVEDGECLAVLEGHRNPVRSVAFSPNGKIIASGSGDRTVQLWEVVTPQDIRRIRTLEGHEGWVLSVAFSPDGSRLVSAGEDSKIRLWETQTGRHLSTIKAHNHWVWQLSYSPDGKTLASASGDGSLKLWKVGENWQVLKTLQGHTATVRAVAINPAGTMLASGSVDQTVKIWDLASGESLKTFQGYNRGVRALAFSPDGQQLVTASGDKSIKLWQLGDSKWQFLRSMSGFRELPLSVAFSPDGQTVAVGTEENGISLWDVLSGQLIKNLRGHNNWVQSVSFSPDGNLLASGSSDRTVRVWQVYPPHNESSVPVAVFEVHKDWVWSVAFNPNGTTLAGAGEDGNLFLWETSGLDFKETAVLHPNQNWVITIAFSRDGRLLATGGGDDKELKIYDTATNQHLSTLVGHTRLVWSMSFSPDNRLLASASDDGTIRLWDVASAQCLQVLTQHSGWVRSVAFSPDNRLLASASDDGTIRLWKMPEGKCIQILQNDRPYERVNIEEAIGLNAAQIVLLKSLGAVD